MKPLTPLSPTGLTPLKRPKTVYNPPPDGVGEGYTRVACEALGIPYERDPRKVYHFLGWVNPRHPSVIEALALHYYRQEGKDVVTDGDVMFLSEYLSQKWALPKTLNGYMGYVALTVPKFRAILDSLTLPLLVEENPNKPHGYILGTPGSGKSELLKALVHTYVTNPRYGSVVVMAPASDFISQIAHWKEFNRGNRLIYVNPALSHYDFPTINPFEISGVDAEDYSPAALRVKAVVAQELVNALGLIVSESGGITGPMRTVLSQCVLALLDYRGATLRDLLRLVKDDQELISFAASLRHRESDYFQGRFSHPNNNATKDAIARRLDGLLTYGPFARLTCGKSTIDLEDAMERKKVILFDLSRGAIGPEEGAAIGRLVIAMILGIAFRRKNPVPCSLVVDECHNYISESMEEILTEARKYRISLTLAQQTAGQRMPVALKDAVLNASNLQVIGGTPRSGASRNADLLGINAEEVRTLRVGEFFIRPDRAGDVVRFQARDDLVDWKNSVSKPTWRRILGEQRRRYYVRQGERRLGEGQDNPDDVPESSEW